MASNNPSDDIHVAQSSSSGDNIPRGLLGKGGTPVSKSTRLPSVRAARDLTLGGTQRKTFKPNIPVRPREKPSINKPVEDKLKITAKKPKKDKFDRPGGSSARGRGGGRPPRENTYIQSQSIFEQGPTEKTIKRESIYGGSGGGEGGGGGGGVRSSTKVTITNAKQTKKETQEIYDQLMRDDFIDDGAEAEEDDLTDYTNQPVALPLLNPSKYEDMIKEELKIKPDSKTEIDVKDPSLSAQVVDHQEDSLKLVLLQLPDCLPGLLTGEDDRLAVRHPSVAQVKQEPGTPAQPTPQQDTQQKSADSELSDALASRCKLTDIPEGKIGKLQVMKSGKTRLVLGDVTFDLSRGAPCGFLQELVYVNASEDHGEMACLGRVKEKLVAIPNIDKLLNS